MTDILGLVRSGNLGEATDAIQGRLTGGSDDTATQADLRDITPDTDVPTPPQALPQTDRGSTRGALPYRLHTPLEPVAHAPLIVMLHGCGQTADDFATATRMNAAADRIGAHVIWPEQLRSANANGCWNWFETAHQGRGGEAAAIADIVRDIAETVAPRASGIHVAGLSAGGAMAAILGESYPDLFASVGIHSGLPVGSAHDMMSAFLAMRSGGTAARPVNVPAIVFHGTADHTVSVANGTALSSVAADGAKPRRRTIRRGGRETTILRATTQSGTPWSEYWQVDGLGHAWSGGDDSGSFADPRGPDATREMLRFFAEVDAASSRRR